MRQCYVLWVTFWRRSGLQQAHVSQGANLLCSILDMNFGEFPFHDVRE
jgi:hypothetical protein